MLVAPRVTVFVCLFFIIFMLWQYYKESKKNCLGGIKKQHETIGSIIKNQEVSESFRRCKEAYHQNHNKQTNKNTVALKPQVDSKISTVKKLITLLIRDTK